MLDPSATIWQTGMLFDYSTTNSSVAPIGHRSYSQTLSVPSLCLEHEIKPPLLLAILRQIFMYSSTGWLTQSTHSATQQPSWPIIPLEEGMASEQDVKVLSNIDQGTLMFLMEYMLL